MLLALAGVTACVRLGFWQLHRADEKRDLIGQFEAGTHRTVATTTNDLQKLPRYQQIEIRGTYDPAHQILLDNMPSHTGVAGFRVLTPLLADNGWVLVDRGWIALGATRAQLPDVDVGGEARTIVGRLDDLPKPGVRMGENPLLAEDAAWPRILNFPTHSELARVLKHGFDDRIVLLDPAQPDGFERVWEAHFGFGPDRHIAYAVQWFALALAIFITFLIVSFKPDAS